MIAPRPASPVRNLAQGCRDRSEFPAPDRKVGVHLGELAG
jgi:hypothetical protein